MNALLYLNVAGLCLGIVVMVLGLNVYIRMPPTFRRSAGAREIARALVVMGLGATLLAASGLVGELLIRICLIAIALILEGIAITMMIRSVRRRNG